jgi:hypothetical protein
MRKVYPSNSVPKRKQGPDIEARIAVVCILLMLGLALFAGLLAILVLTL